MFIEVMAQSIQGTAWNAVELYGKAVTSRQVPAIISRTSSSVLTAECPAQTAAAG
jgi:hypothetical protein